MKKRTIIEEVRDQYANVAQGQLSNDQSAVRAVAAAFGYSADELSQLPPEANMGLSCGNPLALAGLRAGETIVDLGCGGGMDVFLAARKVGPTGRVIGIDMTAEMLERARTGQQKLGLQNVEFHLATIDRLPLDDQSVDCVISNCVINLVPDKLEAFREILRILKPGGRVAISDIALKQPLPDEVKSSVEAYVGCISGALLIDDYRNLLERAGFTAITVTDTHSDLNAYKLVGNGGCCGGQSCNSDSENQGSSVHTGLTSIMQAFDANAYAASVRVHALKSVAGPATNARASAASPSNSFAEPRKSIQVYDKPMCCSTGICGPDVDPVLPRFAADLDWLKGLGHQVERFNLAQQPQAFIQNVAIHQLLSQQGTDCLPVIIVDGQIVSRQTYPTRDALAAWVSEPTKKASLPVAVSTGGCCGPNGCC